MREMFKPQIIEVVKSKFSTINNEKELTEYFLWVHRLIKNPPFFELPLLNYTIPDALLKSIKYFIWHSCIHENFPQDEQKESLEYSREEYEFFFEVSLKIYPKKSSDFTIYNRFQIENKNKKRIIFAPKHGLKKIQKIINFILQYHYPFPAMSTGFVPGKSIKDNAQKHIPKKYVFNID